MRFIALAAPTVLGLFCLAGGGGVASATEQAQQTGMTAAGHSITLPNQLNWQPAPAGLPAGAQVAVVQGDPGASTGTFTLRLKAPAGWSVPTHSHSNDEQLTMISGTMRYGIAGETENAIEMPAGSFVFVPGKQTHNVLVGEQGMELQVHGISPFDITYVNPADDPRQEQAHAK